MCPKAQLCSWLWLCLVFPRHLRGEGRAWHFLAKHGGGAAQSNSVSASSMASTGHPAATATSVVHGPHVPTHGTLGIKSCHRHWGCALQAGAQTGLTLCSGSAAPSAHAARVGPFAICISMPAVRDPSWWTIRPCLSSSSGIVTGNPDFCIMF